MRIVLYGERPISWNKFYSGMHWDTRNKLAQVTHLLVRNELPVDATLFNVPVAITVTAYFKNRPQDPDNICAKLYIDGLIKRVIVDDSPQWVTSVTTRSRIDKENPRVEIDISEDKQKGNI